MKIAEAKEIAIVAIIIGFLVGLTVNQLTDLISILKPCQIEYVIIIDLEYFYLLYGGLLNIFI